MLCSESQGSAYRQRVAGVETAGNIGLVYVGHDLGVQTHGPAAETLAQVAVEKHVDILSLQYGQPAVAQIRYQHAAGAVGDRQGGRAASSATCGVTPQAQNRGSSSARTLTGSP